MTKDGVDVTFKLDPEEPGAFRISLLIHDPARADGVTSAFIPWEDDAALAAWAGEHEGLLLFSAPSATHRLPMLDAALRATGRPYSLKLMNSDNGPVVLNRSSFGATHSSILRAQ